MNGSGVTYSHLFSGKRLLIIEDQYFLTDETRRKLYGLGTILLGPADRVEYALELLENQDVDAAILDVRLEPAFVFQILEALEKLRLPHLFAINSVPAAANGDFEGFVLSESATELEHVAKALFSQSRHIL